MMTPTQIALVQTSFAKVAPLGGTVAALFYARLFHLDPSLRTLFHTDMADQGTKLLAMLTVVVKGLSRLDALVPQVAALGRRHATYGALPAHYDTVGQALLDTLQEGLGDAFGDDERAAWAAAYHLLAQTMIQAAAPKGAAA